MTSELQKKSELLQESNSRLEIEVEALKIQLDAMKNDKERMMSERDDLAASHQRNLEVSKASLGKLLLTNHFNAFQGFRESLIKGD